MDKDKIGGTLIAYYYICKRKLYLFANNIRFEDFSDLVKIGKNTHKGHYNYKPFKEVEFKGSKFDFLKVKNEVIVSEVKTSKALEEASIWQLKYYIWQLKESGINCQKGMLHYPKLMRRIKVELTEKDIEIIQETEKKIKEIIHKKKIPEPIKKGYCSRCAYYEFCFI